MKKRLKTEVFVTCATQYGQRYDNDRPVWVVVKVCDVRSKMAAILSYELRF
jgi:hypothetical protein